MCMRVLPCLKGPNEVVLAWHVTTLFSVVFFFSDWGIIGANLYLIINIFVTYLTLAYPKRNILACFLPSILCGD